MKMNRNQALYRALPGCWVHYSDSEKSDDYKYACKVDAWNTKKVLGINEELIKKNIERRVNSFINTGAESDEFSFQNLEFVEPALNEGIPDIICSINPSTYYCTKCNIVESYYRSSQAPYCKICKVKMNQLQMVYVCECGYAEGVKLTRKEKMFYHSWDKNNQFKFFTEKGSKEEMQIKCPLCGKLLRPKNATDSRLFYSHSGNVVNLYNEEFANVLKIYGINAELLMLAKWFNIIDNDRFNKIIHSPRDFFEKRTRSESDYDVLSFAKALGKTPAEIVEMLSAGEDEGISKVKTQINQIYPLDMLASQLNLITSELMEFDTLKYPKSIISLEDSFKISKENDVLFDEEEVKNLINNLGISNIQISEAVQIVNYAYGFTRLKSCPDGTDSNQQLKLKGFDHNKVFISNLETEGLLIEISMLKILDWLKDNDLVSKDLVIDNEIDAKKWFIENIKLDTITHFSSIPYEGNIITKVVYSLLHTISHMLIISAGKHSGLSKESISELIFLDACSIFIYPTSSEGVTLGSISGMFESNLLGFLEDALNDNEICTFDPICMNEQNGACIACAYLSEVNCTHFNKDLSRSYLYGGKDKEILIKKGFWK